MKLNELRQIIREEISKNMNEQTNVGLITFEQLKQACIDEYLQHIPDGSNEDEAVMEGFDEVTNMEELIELLDGMGYNGYEAFEFIFDAILK
jgi:predicted transcriptional regulator